MYLNTEVKKYKNKKWFLNKWKETRGKLKWRDIKEIEKKRLHNPKIFEIWQWTNKIYIEKNWYIIKLHVE